MALRNLRRHLRRTILTATSIAVGLAIVLWLQCILAGRSQNIIETVTGNYTGYLQVYHNEFLEDKALNKSFTGIPPEAIAVMGKDTNITYRVQLPSLVSTGENSAPVLLVGIQPSNEAKITKIKNSLDSGTFLVDDLDQECPSRQIYIGSAMAKFLNADIGSKIVLLGQASDGTLGNELFRVVGTFKTKSAAFDKSMVFAPITCVQKMGIIDGFHEAVIGLKSGAEIEVPGFLEKISSKLPQPLKLTTWKETQPAIAGLIRFNDLFFKAISAILFLVMILGIVNTMFMSVMERTREFGVMVAIGTTPAQLLTIVLIESFILGFIASMAGLLLGSLVVFYHSQYGFDMTLITSSNYSVDHIAFDALVYPILQIKPFISTVVVTIGFVMVAGFLPALRAARLKPVDAMSTH